MKNIKIFVFTVCFLTGVFAGCTDLLNEDPSHRGTAETFFPTPKGFEAAVNACYGALRMTNHERFLWLRGIDQFSVGEGYPYLERPGTYNDLDNYSPQAMESANGNIKNFWDRHFIAVDRCNRFLSLAKDATVAQDLINKRMGEVTVLRAWYYFQLVQQFGDIPFPLEPYAELQSTAERIPVETIYAQLISDLEAVSTSNALPATLEQPGRITRAACWMVLSKIYLTRAWSSFAQSSDFANAAKYADKIIDESPFQLLDKYHMIFVPNNEKNSEVILSIQWSKDRSQAQWDWAMSADNWGNNIHSKFGIAYDGGPGGIRSNFYNRLLRVYNEQPYLNLIFGVDTLANPGKSYIAPPQQEAITTFPHNHSYTIDSRYDGSFIRLYMAERTEIGRVKWVLGEETKVNIMAAPGSAHLQEVPIAFNQEYFNRGYNIDFWEGARDTSIYLARPCESHLWPMERWVYVKYNVELSRYAFADENSKEAEYYKNENGVLTGYPRVNWVKVTIAKFWEPQTIYSDNWGVRDFILFRKAEAYLLAAEAYYKMGESGKAADRINVLRQRACTHSNPNYMDVKAADIDIDFILD